MDDIACIFTPLQNKWEEDMPFLHHGIESHNDDMLIVSNDFNHHGAPEYYIFLHCLAISSHGAL